jgi:hypothetical protein
VLLAIVPLISRKKKEKVELEKKGGPTRGVPKTRLALWWHVGRWAGLPTRAAPLLGPPQKGGELELAGPFA